MNKLFQCHSKQKTNKFSWLSGILVIDKEEGITSYGVVARLRNMLKVKKIGHTGTLDPFATGILPICIGNATRIIPFLDEGKKEYRFVIKFGIETDTWDPTGNIVKKENLKAVPRDEIEDILPQFTGNIELTVPLFSAVKINGKRLYNLARKGIPVTPPVRMTKVFQLNLIDYNWPEVSFWVSCGRGTYVRSLGVYMGKTLGRAVHVKSLRRERSGPFTLSEAISLSRIEHLAGTEDLTAHMISMNSALNHLPQINIDEQQASLLRKGHVQKLTLEDSLKKIEQNGLTRLVLGEDDLVAMADINKDENHFKVVKVFVHCNMLQK